MYILPTQYRAGLHRHSQDSAAGPSEENSASGGVVNVSDAWLEFILLCQCQGPYQDGIGFFY